MTNDLFANADPVAIEVDGDTFVSAAVPNAGFGVETGENSLGYNTAWWWYQPTSDGYADFDTELSTGSQNTILTLFLGPPHGTATVTTVSVVDQSDDFFGSPWSKLGFVEVTAGTTYYIQVGAQQEDDPMDYVLRVTGPAHAGGSGAAAIAAPPIVLSMAQGNDDFVDAETVHIPYDGGEYVSEATSNAAAGLEPGEPDSGRTRSIWWRYVPLSDGSASFDTELQTGASDTAIAVYTGSAVTSLSPLTQDTFGTNGDGTARVPNVAVTAGTVYHVAVLGSSTASYLLRVVGPATLVTGAGLNVPPVDVTAQVAKPSLGTVVTDAAPIDVTTDAGVPKLPRILRAAPITVGLDLRAPSSRRISRILVQPANHAVVPVTRPTFSIALQALEGSLSSVGIDVAYDTDPQFGTATILHTDTALVVGPNAVTLATQTTLPTATAIWWRARLIIDGATMAWTTPWTFTIDPTAGDATTAVTFTVHIGLTDPHLWFVRPAAGAPGDRATVYGQGFPTAAEVRIGGAQATIVSRTTVASTAAATTAGRSTLDAEHDEIVFTIPDVSAPGGPLLVAGQDQ